MDFQLYTCSVKKTGPRVFKEEENSASPPSPLNAPVGFLKADERMLRCKLFTVPASNWRNHLPMWVQELKVKGTKTKGASIPGEGRDPQYPWSTVQLIKVVGLSQPQSQGTSQIPGAA